MNRVELSLIAMALVFLAMAVAAPAVVRLNFLAYRLLGLDDLARWWERRLGWVTPAVRAVAVCGTFIMVYLLLRQAWS